MWLQQTSLVAYALQLLDKKESDPLLFTKEIFQIISAYSLHEILMWIVIDITRKIMEVV